MSKQILVLMKRNDRVEDLLPYVEKVARPGMQAVFMPTNGTAWLAVLANP